MLTKIESKKLDGSKLKIAIVRSVFNDKITANLLTGCLKSLTKQQVATKKVIILEVPGAMELSVTVKKIIKKFDVVICLGAIIRGGTPHFNYVSSESARGILLVSLESVKPVINGVLTCDNLKQAVERSSDNNSNKGWQSGIAAVEMGLLFKKI